MTWRGMKSILQQLATSGRTDTSVFHSQSTASHSVDGEKALWAYRKEPSRSFLHNITCRTQLCSFRDMVMYPICVYGDVKTSERLEGGVT